MANLREVRDILTIAYTDGMLSNEQFLLLYDINTSHNPDYPYWNYEAFDLDKLDNDECWVLSCTLLVKEVRLFSRSIYLHHPF